MNVIRLHAIRRLAGLLLIVALTSACVQQTKTSYVRPSNSALEHGYVKQGTDFSQYTKLMVDGLGIYYPESDIPPRDEDLQRIRDSFRRAFATALGGDYPIVSEAGPDVLKVRAEIIDMKIIGADGDFSADGRLRDLVSRGELTFLMEILDSESGEVLARAGDRTSDITTAGESADWAEVERAAEHWAGMFRDWLDRSLGKTTR
jgi:hypothetical protein